MKKTFQQYIALTFTCFMCMAATTRAQSVFQVADGSGLAFPSYFEIGADTGRFQIDNFAYGQFQNGNLVSFPTLPDDSTALIITPAGTLTFSIGVGTPTGWDNGNGDMFPNPFAPPPPVMIGSGLAQSGVQFNGSFTSSAGVYNDLLAGLGDFEIITGPSEYRIGQMEVTATPEPGSAALLLCGLMLLIRQGIKHPCNGWRVYLTSRRRSQSRLALSVIHATDANQTFIV
jgi:hypothetical protein